jgi:glycerate 2-kinase
VRAEPPLVLCCPDKFRGTIDAPAAAAALARGVEAAGLRALAHPLADGGEGTLEAVLAAHRVEPTLIATPDPLGRALRARVAMLPGGLAVVELAEASGLQRLAESERDPMRASSAGTGKLISAALDLGARRLVVAVGGSAAVDGGLGAIRVLGARLLDGGGGELDGSGADLERLASIDAGCLDSRLGRIPLEIAVDVECPLAGPGGAAQLFGPQKGASPEQAARLDRGLARLADLLGLGAGDRARLGAAGGFAAPLVALAGARVVSGAAFVRDLTGFEAALGRASLCITGEGRADGSSALGKTVGGVLDAAAEAGVPAIVAAGEVAGSSASLFETGAAGVFGILRSPGDLSRARESAASDLEWFGRSAATLFSRSRS